MSTTPAYAATKAAAAKPSLAPTANSGAPILASADGKAAVDSTAVADLKADVDRNEINVAMINACTTKEELKSLAEKLQAELERRYSEKELLLIEKMKPIADSLDRISAKITIKLHDYSDVDGLTFTMESSPLYAHFLRSMAADKKRMEEALNSIPEEFRGKDLAAIDEGKLNAEARVNLIRARTAHFAYTLTKSEYDNNLRYITELNKAKPTVDGINKQITIIDDNRDRLATLLNDDLDRREGELAELAKAKGNPPAR